MFLICLHFTKDTEFLVIYILPSKNWVTILSGKKYNFG